MKKALLIALLLAVWPAVDRTGSPEKGALAAQQPNGRLDSEEDIFSTADEQELLFRRVFQKSLPRLSAREALIWSFKTAAPTPFL